MKKIFSLVTLCLTIILCLSSCTYNPPEGWTKKHHKYEEVQSFAKSVDPNATVAEEYTETVDEYGWEYREWNAKINGIDCHVASISDWVWNDGFAAGEFARIYYRIDTDHDNTVMQKILSEKYPEWECSDDIWSRYHKENTLFVKLNLPKYRMLNDDEIEEVWQTAILINEEFNAVAIDRKVTFCVPSPGKYWSGTGDEYYVKKDSETYFDDLTAKGKKEFLQEYKENWALLDSNMPVSD